MGRRRIEWSKKNAVIGNREEEYWDELTLWPRLEGVTNALNATGDLGTWSVIILHARGQGT